VVKKILVIFCCFIFSQNSFSQKNAIKGRAFYLPNSENSFSLGFGYERIFMDRFSFQILYNYFGYDSRKFDRQASIFKNLVPEIRYYLGKRKKIFLGLFFENSKERLFYSGVDSQNNLEIYYIRLREKKSPGILLGYSRGLKKNLFWEIYFGGQYQFINETQVSKRGVNYTLKEEYNLLGVRGGINVGFRF